MEQTQWVFWVTGLPLAILTGIFCLWCTSRLGDFKEWLRPIRKTDGDEETSSTSNYYQDSQQVTEEDEVLSSVDW